MRLALLLVAAAVVLGLAAAPIASGQGAGVGATRRPSPARATTARANRQLDGSLNLGMRQAGPFSGAYVVDLTANHTLYSRNAATGRLPASVEKLYTTTAALQRFGP